MFNCSISRLYLETTQHSVFILSLMWLKLMNIYRLQSQSVVCVTQMTDEWHIQHYDC